ncbi:hypothetical protein Ddc_24588 [Ditylenchus destructor]|nr:hypothetical protein Ddc_24588 [Ditylenchus destructor]
MAKFDNDTLVEMFKYLNYCQLAKNSLVSMRFSSLICTHRHKLAFLYVDKISMNCVYIYSFPSMPIIPRIFNKQLTPKAYNEWIIRYGYSKEVPLEGLVRGRISTQDDHNVYELIAYAADTDFNGRGSVFFARAKLMNGNWQLFQHFIRLLMDPFVYICCVEFTPQNDVLNLLAGAISPDRNRVRCGQLHFNLKDDNQKFLSWIKKHVYCDKLQIIKYRDSRLIYMLNNTNSNYDEELLDFFMSGAHCTTEINVKYYDISKVAVNFVQKFLNLRKCDEYKAVESIHGKIGYAGEINFVDVLKRDFANFVVEEKNDGYGKLVIEFINKDIEKKLTLTVGSTHLKISNFSMMIKSQH